MPEEITKELEALSQVDDARKSRIERLEKLRRREEDVLPGNYIRHTVCFIDLGRLNLATLV